MTDISCESSELLIFIFKNKIRLDNSHEMLSLIHSEINKKNKKSKCCLLQL